MSKIILSEKFYDLKFYAKKNKHKYQKSKPYPHIVIKNFFKNEFLNKVLKEFPDLQNTSSSLNYRNKNEVKFANNDKKKLKKNTKIIFKYLNTKKFINFIQILSKKKKKILPDSHLSGGGLHEIKKGGILKVHTDFNKHPFKKLDRRINILIYLNKKWKKKYGGNLELWNKNMKKCEKKIRPTFNTMVIFSTNDFTNHGHPNPLNCPIKMSRKSLATYYFSRGRPNNEISEIVSKNTTVFKNRKGIKNDVSISDNKLRSYVRNLKFFKNLKDFEKKYLRTGKSRQKREN